MEIQFTSLYQVDHTIERNKKIDINSQGEDLKEYNERLIREITNSNSRRKFEFKSETTEVRTAIEKFLNKEYEEGAKINSKRLLEVEINAQSRIAHLNSTIQKGSLFQTVLNMEDSTYIIISKADHNKFLDETDFNLKNGLPWEKRIFKAFMLKIEGESPGEIFVYDTTNRMAKYWWDDFLELKEKYTDAYNTRTSLEILDRKVFNKMKKSYPADYTILRNSAIGYFRNNDEFEINGFIENTLKNYLPVDQDFPKQEFINDTTELPEKWNFDTHFNIKKEEIKKRRISKIPLTDKIELVLKDYISDLENVIEAMKDEEGNKYIRIKSDAGYNRFKRVE